MINMEKREPILDELNQSVNRIAEAGSLPEEVPYVSSNEGVPSYLVRPTGEGSSMKALGDLPPTTPQSSPVGPPPDLAIAIKEAEEGFSSLLNEITLPILSADDETKPTGKWAPKQLSPRHREMMRRILEGATYIEIASEMGISTQSVMLVCSSAIFKEELMKLESELNLDVIRRAEELSNEALDKLKFLMRRARSESLQANCAEKVLGIAGYSKIEKKQVAIVSGEDVIRELNRRRREAAELSTNRDSRTITIES